MPLNVHLAYPPTPEQLAYFKTLLDEGINVSCGDESAPERGAHILVDGRPSREEMLAHPRLQALIIPWAGVPPETAKLLAEFPHIRLHNLHHNNAPTAETALMLLLAAAKCILPIDRAFRQHDWTLRHDPAYVMTLDGKTALILGYGAIGQRVARGCQALGMHILATRRDPDAPAPADITAEIHPPDALPDLLPRAQALIITLPLTPETEGLIGARELALLPPGSVLVNVGRGPIVEEAALYHALKERHLHAAGLDVWYNYPPNDDARTNTPPAVYPFHELDNVVMSPHRGGAFSSDDTEQRRYAALADMVNAAARGEEMPNRVDLGRGY